ncbi:MAG: hypothetical protein V4613_06925 [Bacteroidota bacterium]
MIKQILLAKQNYWQLGFVMLGSFFGLLLVMSSVQLYCDFKAIVANKNDLIAPQFVVVNKPVTLLNTLTGMSSGFNDEEIEALKKVKSVGSVGKFTANQFTAKAAFEFGGSAVYTDMFFEAVPDAFLDISVDNWNWKEGREVPVILPTDYINLYNFGFAPSHGLPQISKATAQMAPIKIKIEGQGKAGEFQGRIAGFTNRINSILVPEKFLNYANSIYGEGTAKKTNRLVVMCNDPGDETLTKYIEEQGYETNLELLKNGKLNSLLKVVLSILLVIGGIIILLSITGFIQYAQLLVSNAAYEISTLLQLGYFVKVLFAKILLFYSIVLATVAILGITGLYVVKHYFNAWIIAKGFEPENGISPLVLYTGIGLMLLFLLLNAMNIYRLIRRLAG